MAESLREFKLEMREDFDKEIRAIKAMIRSLPKHTEMSKEARQKLEALEKHFDQRFEAQSQILKIEHDEQTELLKKMENEVQARIKTSTFRWFISIALSVIGAAMGFLVVQNAATNARIDAQAEITNNLVQTIGVEVSKTQQDVAFIRGSLNQ